MFTHRSSAPFVYAHAHCRGMFLRPKLCVTLYILNTLLLELEWPINVVSLLLSCGSYNNGTGNGTNDRALFAVHHVHPTQVACQPYRVCNDQCANLASRTAPSTLMLSCQLPIALTLL